jgi:hypothetical protein
VVPSDNHISLLVVNHRTRGLIVSRPMSPLLLSATMVLSLLRSASSLSLGREMGRGLGRSIAPALEPEALLRVQRCMQFLDAAAEPYTCVDTIMKTLSTHGFKELDESQAWRPSDKGGKGGIVKGGKYFFTRNRSSIVAFTVGGKYESGNRFKVIGAHTDSPNLKIKPKSKKSGQGLTQIAVETYGGGLWYVRALVSK